MLNTLNLLRQWWMAGLAPVFRNPDKYQVLKWRDWSRKNLPTASDGMVLEDLDLVALTYGSLIARPANADGRFRLIEIKEERGAMGYAQQRVFGLIHRLLRQADHEHEFYDGFFLVKWNSDHVVVNGQYMAMDEFKLWMTGQLSFSKCPLSLFDGKKWN